MALAVSSNTSIPSAHVQVLQMGKWQTSCKGYPGKTNLHSCCSAPVEFWVIDCGSYPFKVLYVVCVLFWGFYNNLLQQVVQIHGYYYTMAASNAAVLVCGFS